MGEYDIPPTPLQILGALQHGSKLYGLLRKRKKTYQVYQVFIASLDCPGEIEDITKGISLACKIHLARKGLRITSDAPNSMRYIVNRIQHETGLTGLVYELIKNDYRGANMIKVYAKAVELGAKISGGMNWDWAIGFPTREAGEAFVAYLDTNGYEHRGIYEDKAVCIASKANDESVSVRFR